MKKKYPIYISIIIGLFLVREFGVFDFSYHQQTHTLEDSGGSLPLRSLGNGSKCHFTFINLGYRNGPEHQVPENDNSSEIVVVINKAKYSGNYFTPLSKEFNLSFHAEYFTNSNTNDCYGSYHGTINSDISGICSSREAKRLAYQAMISMIQARMIQHRHLLEAIDL